MAKERISKVTTRSGDSGQTKLATGKTVLKKQTIVRTIGAVDELNSHTGLALVTINTALGSSDGEADQAIQHRLRDIQQSLFDVGAVLAMEGAYTAPEFLPLEDATATLNANLPPLTEFVLPGGNLPSAQLHVCRTVCRRAETEFWTLISETQEPPPAYKSSARYLNRLSDFFFVLARTVNDLAEDQWSGPKRD